MFFLFGVDLIYCFSERIGSEWAGDFFGGICIGAGVFFWVSFFKFEIWILDFDILVFFCNFWGEGGGKGGVFAVCGSGFWEKFGLFESLGLVEALSIYIHSLVRMNGEGWGRGNHAKGGKETWTQSA